jgi:hypothetical protein
MGQHEIVVGVEHRQLMLQAIFTLAQRGDPASHRCHPLTEIEVEPLDKRRRLMLDFRVVELRKCRKGVDSLSDELSEFISIEEESNHEIVHALRLGEHSVRRTSRLIRVRRLMCLLSIFCVFSLTT